MEYITEKGDTFDTIAYSMYGNAELIKPDEQYQDFFKKVAHKLHFIFTPVRLKAEISDLSTSAHFFPQIVFLAMIMKS